MVPESGARLEHPDQHPEAPGRAPAEARRPADGGSILGAAIPVAGLPILALQRAAGNAAVAQLLAGHRPAGALSRRASGAEVRDTARRTAAVEPAVDKEPAPPSLTSSPLLAVQRGPNPGGGSGSGTGPGGAPGGTPTRPPSGAEGLPEGYGGMSDEQKLNAIATLLGAASPTTIGLAWSLLGDQLAAARSRPDVFTASVKANASILDFPAFAQLRTKFQSDVEGKALEYLHANEKAVLAERERTGVPSDGETPGGQQEIRAGKGSSADTDKAVQDVQRAAEEMERIKTGKARCLGLDVGFQRTPIRGGVKIDRWMFQPGSPPPNDNPSAPNYLTVMDAWAKLIASESAIVRKNPSAAFFIGEGGDPSKIKGDKDIRVARAEIATALAELGERVKGAIPKIGHGVSFVDLVPIQRELLGGPVWSKPVENAVAKEAVSDANMARLLESLAISSLSAAFFVFGSILSGGTLAPFLFAAGAGVSGGQAAASWDKYIDLAAAHKGAIDPAAELVSGEQVDDAMITALLDTIFAAIDGWEAAKGIKTATEAASVIRKGGEAFVAGGKAGAASGAAALLKNLQAADKPGEVLARAVAEIGPEGAQQLSGLPYKRLAEIAGGEATPLGERFLLLDAKGAGAVSEETKELIAKLPTLISEPDAGKADEILAAGISQYGYKGVLDRVGGWGAIKGSAVMKGGKGSAAGLEGWRAGLVEELDRFIQEASDKLAKTVRTGSEKASSDLDVQIMGETAADLQKQAEGWLANRLGTDFTGAKRLLDVTVFIDPTRAHLVDLLRDLGEDVRAQIRSEMATIEPPLIMGSRLQAARKYGEEAIAKHGEEVGGKYAKEAVDRVMEDARRAGVAPDETFTRLTPAEQKHFATQIDGWMTELKNPEKVEFRADYVRKVSRAQALIDASHADSYVGGGVAVWVTGRDIDASKIADALKSLNIDPTDVGKFSLAQRISAALAEGKWLDAAVNNLREATADDLDALVEAVRDIAKHGARAAEVLQVPGKTNVGQLTSLMNELRGYGRLTPAELAKVADAGSLGTMRTEIGGLLDALSSATGGAITTLQKQAGDLGVSLTGEMADFKSLLKWHARFNALTAGAKNATAAQIRVLETTFQEAQKALPQESSETPEFLLPPPQSVPPGAPLTAP